jgi:glycosyltransferase involved in cell wall biosynthesis
MSLFVLKALFLSVFTSNAPEFIITFTYNNVQLLAMPFLKLFKKKVIYVSTMDFNAAEKSGNLLKKILYVIDFQLTKLLYKFSSVIVTSSEALAESYNDFLLPDNKVRVIVNGVDTTRFAPISTDKKNLLRKKLTLPEDAFIFLYVGLRTERKGIRLLIESWKIHNQHFPNDLLLLVGNDKPEATSREFNQYWSTEKKKISNGSTRMILRDSSSGIEEYFGVADCFVFLSEKEGMPNVLLEAMSSGLPIILNKFQGFSEVYGRHLGQFYMASNGLKAVLDSMEQVRINNELRNTLALEARSYAVEHFDITKSIKKYLNILK